jgi:hypothetical protein
MKLSPHTAQASTNAPHETRFLPLLHKPRLAVPVLGTGRHQGWQPTRFSSQGRRLLPWLPWQKSMTSLTSEGNHAEPPRAPPPTRRNLHDTHLEPAKRAVHHHTFGSRTSKPCGCRPICFAPLAGWPGSLVTEDPREVCRLSPWDDIVCGRNPYPAHYRPAFACSLILCPQPCQVVLRLPFPRGEELRVYHVLR